jgi:hypothetical protein
MAYLLSIQRQIVRSAGFQTCCAADFQVGIAEVWPAGLETRGTADLEVCATLFRTFQHGLVTFSQFFFVSRYQTFSAVTSRYQALGSLSFSGRPGILFRLPIFSLFPPMISSFSSIMAMIMAQLPEIKKPPGGFQARFFLEPAGICKRLHDNNMQKQKTTKT